jgi:hypothetical protein
VKMGFPVGKGPSFYWLSRPEIVLQGCGILDEFLWELKGFMPSSIAQAHSVENNRQLVCKFFGVSICERFLGIVNSSVRVYT